MEMQDIWPALDNSQKRKVAVIMASELASKLDNPNALKALSAAWKHSNGEITDEDLKCAQECSASYFVYNDGGASFGVNFARKAAYCAAGISNSDMFESIMCSMKGILMDSSIEKRSSIEEKLDQHLCQLIKFVDS